MRSKKKSKELIYADAVPDKKQTGISRLAGKASRDALERLDDYDHHLFRAFTICFIRTAILTELCIFVYKNINRSNVFFAIFIPVILFFFSSVLKYCFVPKMGTPYVLNMAFFYSGVSLVLFNVFTHNSTIGLLSTDTIPGAIIAIGPCMAVFFLIYMLAMKLDVICASKIRDLFGKITSKIFRKSH